MTEKNQEKPWIKNAPSNILINSIFAALSGILITIVFQDTAHFEKNWYIPVVVLAVSFWLFALTAEMFATALDENDVNKYVFFMIPYNIGVILLIFAIVYLIYYRYCSVIHVFGAWIVLPITFLFSFYPWVWDLTFLLCNKKDFKNYLDELEGLIEPNKDNREWFINKYLGLKGLYCKTRKGNKKKLPHNNVYTRLCRSPIHGIGVFAIRDIPKGTNLFADDESQMVEYDQEILKDLSPEIKQLYDDFCIFKSEDKKMLCPLNFNHLTVGWYLNYSETPNTSFSNDNDNFYALGDIKKGEELTVDYATFSDLPPGYKSFTQ